MAQKNFEKIDSALFFFIPRGYHKFRAHRFKTQTQTRPFLVHRSVLRCSNLAASLSNKTPTTGHAYIERTAPKFFLTPLSEIKLYYCCFSDVGLWNNTLLLSTVELIPDEKKQLRLLSYFVTSGLPFVCAHNPTHFTHLPR